MQYQLEYGLDALEVHNDAVRGGARVLVHDDLLATGGTAAALCDLVEQAGGVVAGCAFVVELSFLEGRERLSGREVHSLVALRRRDMPTVSARRSLDAPPDEVWRLVSDPERLPAWWPRVHAGGGGLRRGLDLRADLAEGQDPCAPITRAWRPSPGHASRGARSSPSRRSSGSSPSL